MSVPFHKSGTAADELDKAGKFIKKHHQRYEGITDAEIARADALHLEGLRNGWLILNALANAPADDLVALLELHAKAPAVFEAIMVLVRIELERPAPAEEQVAA